MRTYHDFMSLARKPVSTARRLLASAGRITLGVIVGAIVANPILLYFQQEKLLFYPVRINEESRRFIRAQFRNVEEVVLPAADGTRLHGWYQRSPGAGRKPLLIYFGGNAEDISHLPAKSDKVAGWSLLMINYRGYGLSEGEPGEKALFADALLIFDAARRRDDVDPQRIAVMGRSLGTGVAAYLASQRPVRAAVLVTPYDSIRRVAQSIYWWVPVSLILKHPFDSLALAPKVDTPALFMVAGEDTLIPSPHSLRLFEAWAGPKRWHLVPRHDHDSIDADDGYWRVIAEFLAASGKPVAAKPAPPQ